MGVQTYKGKEFKSAWTVIKLGEMTDIRDTKAMNKDSQKEILGTPKRTGYSPLTFMIFGFFRTCISSTIARGLYFGVT